MAPFSNVLLFSVQTNCLFYVLRPQNFHHEKTLIRKCPTNNNQKAWKGKKVLFVHLKQFLKCHKTFCLTKMPSMAWNKSICLSSLTFCRSCHHQCWESFDWWRYHFSETDGPYFPFTPVSYSHQPTGKWNVLARTVHFLKFYVIHLLENQNFNKKTFDGLSNCTLYLILYPTRIFLFIFWKNYNNIIFVN